MKPRKIKTFVITVAKTFPTTHKRKGEPTNFRQQIEDGTKIHTMRLNYPYWENIVDQVNSGDAIISLRQWIDKPYSSKQEEFKVLTQADNISIQKFTITSYIRIDGNSLLFSPSYLLLANNDGLSYHDFVDWFKIGENNIQGGIIHFTSFKY